MRAEALGINRKNIYRLSKLEEKDLAVKEAINKTHKDHPGYGHCITLYIITIMKESIRH